MTLTNVHQVAAGLSYRRAAGDINAATSHFTDELRAAKFDLPSNPQQYVAQWGPRLRDDGTIDSRATLSGRKRKLTDDMVNTIHYEAIHWFLAGREQPYSSIKELRETNTTVQGLLAGVEVGDKTIIRSVQELFPEFKFGKLRKKSYLDERHRAMRMWAAEDNSKLSADTLNSVVWADEKTLPLQAGACVGWYDAGGIDYAYERRAATHNKQPMKLKYLIAVSPLLGPFYIKFYTGTSGLADDDDGDAYLVSSACEQHRRLACLDMQQCRPQPCLPSAVAAPLLIPGASMRPQHTVAGGGGCCC